MAIFNFDIQQNGSLSRRISALGLTNFVAVAEWVEKLPYRRNTDKARKDCIIHEHCGTCSTKHAFLKTLADENGRSELKLMVGIFKMNSSNTPAISNILTRYHLNYIPEAHCYLRHDNGILDYTGINGGASMEEDLLTEIEIEPQQITDFKVDWHKQYLKEWLRHEPHLSFDEIWLIREECIREIARKQTELTTERLYLRPFREDDAELMFDLNADWEVLKYTGDKQFTDIAAARAFLKYYDQYEKYSTGRLIVELRDSKEILGWCGLKHHPDVDETDIGYRFFRKHWGKGYATESAGAVLKYGFDKLNLPRIVGRARQENLASISVLQKLGMTLKQSYTENSEQWLLFEKLLPYHK